ncbi:MULTISPECIES: metal ABC transporter solute-binding protein, Zn/Mn family [unclassified Nesterenkonia]|uniref:metal ABC transporter solute-binding protein, Zn/Mn family n=1 Tax=unclassified Nesterenkonia TaxID=2629769 RepID=UPI001F4D0B31|nr:MULTISPECIES: zinc ABC transporter substrate-binding protein [unclassified Nesterenkonia]MCH8559565.1 zinc ABC transporter substrate-binding protein [Nesterenkonia sp. DZ6]MCH8561742.1 zinc ABC transporter substrate-binding protein [Nesterenkonia sp. YGD6]MCH8570359.1 zinc ABC transporter substrate-binding protein [Nesterenkonia sp. AY15]
MRHTRFFTVTAGLICALALSSCAAANSDEQGASTEDQPPVVLTSFSVLADMTRAVGGDLVDTRSITPPGAEVHEYSPTPGDLRDAAAADVIFFNGLGLEAWYEQFLSHSSAEVVMLSESVETLPVTRLPEASPGSGESDDVEDPGASESAGAEETAELPVNPHAWMSPAQAMVYVDNIEAALSELSPADAEQFTENAGRYREQIQAVWDQAEERLAPLQQDGEIHLVTCEGAFSYLAKDLDLGEHYLWPLNAEDEGSPKQVEAQIRYVEEHQVPTIFCESTVNDSTQRQVAETTGATLSEPLHVDSITEPDGPAPSYLELLEHDLDLIIEGAQR